ncbi:MAG: c-type cytochrome [Ideonella sp.]|nr:c-type cytochrome [Ideonella sp.]MCC7456132.1 c-type cytochrome [Nitrospira sp.]
MRSSLLVVALVLGAWAPGASAQDTSGRNLAAACAICHGTSGHVPASAPVSALAGMPREQITERMRAFRDGKRAATVMHQIAKGYTDAQIDALAAFYAAQKR